ncbi:MAG: hypothetical protein QOH71_3966 [Blastocatellia bacterium]|jgi:tetratricopeptide (TPR) repeat protein|nr:hypothetical protein [Blastocatellia bacterium]
MSKTQTRPKEINEEAALRRLEGPPKRAELPAATLYIGIFLLVIAAAAYFVFPSRSNQQRIAGLYLAKAKALMRHDEFAAAADELAKVRLTDPKNIQAQTEQLKATIHQIAKQSDPLDRLLDLEKLAKAEADCMRLLEENPGSAEITALLGIVYAHRDQPSLAFQTYQRAQELDPSFPNVHNYWGYSAVQWQFPDQRWNELAAQKFTEAQKLDPTYVTPLINIALLKYFEGDFETASNLLSQAEKIGTENEILYALWGVSLDSWARKIRPTDEVGAFRKLSEALDKYRIAEALNPNLAVIHFNKARTLDYLGRADAAIEEYTKALQLEPGLALAQVGLAEVLIDRNSERKDIDDALAHLNEAIRVTTQTIEQYKYRKTKTTDQHAQEVLDRWIKKREGDKRDFEGEAVKASSLLIGAARTDGNAKAKKQ